MAGHIEHVETFVDPGARARGVSRARVRVHNRNCANLQICGSVVPIGTHEIQVYEDEIAGVLALVEPAPEQLEAAKHALELEIAQEIAQKFPDAGDAGAVLKAVKANKDARLVKAYEDLAASAPVSAEAIFTRNTKRAPLPLVSAEVLEKGIPEPQKAQAMGERAELVSAIAEIAAKTMEPMIRKLVDDAIRNSGNRKQ